MKHFSKIPIWENTRRLNKLLEFRELVVNYFNNIRMEGFISEVTENSEAQRTRMKINTMLMEIHEISVNSGTVPYMKHTSAPAFGSQVTRLDLIEGIFSLHHYNIGGQNVIDYIERVIGIYQRNHMPALIRVFNPFYYIGLVFDTVSEIPSIAISSLGINRQKFSSSIVGRFVKTITYLISVLASFLTVLHYLGLLDPVKSFILERV